MISSRECEGCRVAAICSRFLSVLIITSSVPIVWEKPRNAKAVSKEAHLRDAGAGRIAALALPRVEARSGRTGGSGRPARLGVRPHSAGSRQPCLDAAERSAPPHGSTPFPSWAGGGFDVNVPISRISPAQTGISPSADERQSTKYAITSNIMGCRPRNRDLYVIPRPLPCPSPETPRRCDGHAPPGRFGRPLPRLARGMGQVAALSPLVASLVRLRAGRFARAPGGGCSTCMAGRGIMAPYCIV